MMLTKLEIGTTGTFSPSATHLIKTCRAKGKTFETLTHFVCLQNAQNQQMKPCCFRSFWLIV
jgi:hypothetical protein